MKKDIDPRVKRWLERFDPVQGVFDTVEMSAHMTLDEKGELTAVLCRGAARMLDERSDKLEVLARKMPRPPESQALWRMLVARTRAERAARAG